MPSAVANLPTTQHPTRHATLFTEYQEAYQWRGLPEKPVATNDDNDYPQVHIDQAMYNSTSRDAYKKYDPDAYRREMPADDESDQKAPVDPSMYNTTSRDAYKKYDPDAYKREMPADDESDQKAPVDPSMYNTTSRDAYKKYDPDAYKREMPVDEFSNYREIDREMFMSSCVKGSQECEAVRSAGDVLDERIVYGSSAGDGDGRAERGVDSRGVLLTEQQKEVAGSIVSEASAMPAECLAPTAVYSTPAKVEEVHNRRGLACPSIYESTYAKDYIASGSVTASLAGNSAVPPLSIPTYRNSGSKKNTGRSSVRASTIASQAKNSAAAAAKYQAPSSERSSAEEMPVKKVQPGAPAQKEVLAIPQPRRKGSYETEYNKNYRAYSSMPTPLTTPRHTQACVHHVDPAFYTTTCNSAYAAPPPAPVRSAFTRPAVAARHMDPAFYTTTCNSAYAAPPPAPARSAFPRPAVAVRHVNPSMYVSTSRATYL